MPEARKATAADIDALSGALARAFADDPLMAFIFPERERLSRMQRYFAAELRTVFLGLDEVWTTPERVGAALWAPPQRWRRSAMQVARGAPTAIRTIGTRLAATVRVLSVIERAHPPGPHYYLAGLGTDPAHQRTGVASALLAPVLDRCDREGLGAYLESSKEQNLAFYNRHGFEVTRELSLPNAAPPVWLMWREPR